MVSSPAWTSWTSNPKPTKSPRSCSTVSSWFACGDTAFPTSLSTRSFFADILGIFSIPFFPSISLPDVLAHFDSLGFDLSILVTRWFIPLFATALPFSALFRFYDYLFVVGLSALFRLSVALLSQFRQLVLASDLVQLSGLIHTLGTERLKREKDVQTLFRILRQLTDVTPG